MILEKTNGKEVKHKYNNINQLTSKTSLEGNFTYKCDKRGNLLEEKKEGEVQGTYKYNGMNKLEEGTVTEGATKESSKYTYNGLGNRVKLEQHRLNPNISYTNNDNAPASGYV